MNQYKGVLGALSVFIGAPIQPDIMPNSHAALMATRNYALLGELTKSGLGFQGSFRSTFYKQSQHSKLHKLRTCSLSKFSVANQI